MDQVILVDHNDNEVGSMEKIEAHKKGLLHRAFSIFLFNSKGEVLLQKRALTKYHSGGLWTNTCCSHPVIHENIEITAKRKLLHEMGIEAPINFSHKFIYKTLLGDLTEHELDYVFFGTFDGTPNANPEEVEDWKFISIENLYDDIKRHPENYTSWFKIILAQQEFQALTI